MSKYLHINCIQRITVDGELEEITFDKGVNLITGRSNAGKTVWLQMIDYLLGKSGTWKEMFLDADIAEKYIEIIGYFDINGTVVKISRKPQETGMATKVLIDDIPFGADEFSSVILQKIGFPDDVKFPQGNPYTSKWVELSFRAIYRHIYRREVFWSDIADKQPPLEQYAAQYQLLGIAKEIYSKEYNDDVVSGKELAQLEAQKTQFNKILNRIAQEMAPKVEEQALHYANENDVAIRIANLESGLIELEKTRSELIQAGMKELEARRQKNQVKETEFATKKTSLFDNLENVAQNISKSNKRITEFKAISDSITEELAKLKRTKKAGIISDIKITICPACDQKVDIKPTSHAEQCFLCHQTLDIENKSNVLRIDFEISQLESEQAELVEMMDDMKKKLMELQYEERSLQEQINYLDRQIAPLRELLFAFTNQELSEIDVQRGRIQEQIQNYKRLLNNIGYKEELNREILAVENKIRLAREKQTKATQEINYATIADDLSDGMQHYLDAITQSKKGWSHGGKVSIAINDTRIAFYVDNKNWNSLGGLDRKYFLLSYHYGLLTLTDKKKYQYPGLVIIDLDAEFAEASKGSHNHIIEPFVKYCNALKEQKPLQVIISGRAFDGLVGVRNINFDNVWI